jgi:molybdenum cofactor cytidylyltransferase
MTQPLEQLPVDGVVLAAGRSSRMGEPKARLEIAGRSFLEQAVHSLRDAGCRYVVAVLRGDDDWSERLADVSGAAVVLNEDASSEQHDSIRLGIAALPADSGAVLVLPVDFPLVRSDTIRTLIAQFQNGDATVVRPTHAGTPGHPTLFARALYEELARADLPEGARTVIASQQGHVRDVGVDDPGVTIDIDTPEDYEHHVAQRRVGE